jgi:surface polysaccharide O-acyltransferase-like enzyme
VTTVRVFYVNGQCVSNTISESDSTKKEESFSLPVDLIRTVGILLVVMLHASNEYYTAIFQTPLESASYWWTATVYKFLTLSAVPIFIMLSGALLLQPSKTGEPIKVFLKKRANRIGWAFAFWSAIYLAWGFFISGTPVTFYNVIQGIIIGLFTGPWYHFWFLYLIAGLYLITPILRVIVANRNQNLIMYLVILWFIGVSIVPLLHLITGYSLNGGVFVLGGTIGYFMLGAYLQKARVRPSILYGMFILGFVWTVSTTWVMRFIFPSVGEDYFFFDYLSANIVIASVALFTLLSRFKADWPGSNHPRLSRVVRAISANTLPIYLFHVIILMSLQRGFFGFTLSLTTMNPIIGVPIITAATFVITFGLILIMKRVPVLRKLLG